jgi:exodeoxyribonuclease III
MPSVRVISWNCHHGEITTRLSELARYSADLVFLQECAPQRSTPAVGHFCTTPIGTRKSIVLGSPNPKYQFTAAGFRLNAGRAAVAARLTGPTSFAALGIWSQGPKYVDDVLRSLDAYSDVVGSRRAIVLGDLNSGTDLRKRGAPTKNHARLLDAFAHLGLVSAYHSFHEIEHGHESHATYHHQFRPAQPWHIDFCFVPQIWAPFLQRVKVITGPRWFQRSDHLPLCVDIQVPG